MAEFADPQHDTNATRVVLAAGSASNPSLVWANDETKGFYYDDTTGEITAIGFNGGVAGADTHLSNLASPTNINQSLLFDLDGTYQIGDETHRLTIIWTQILGVQPLGVLDVQDSNAIVHWRINPQVAAGQTSMLLYDADSTTLKRVLVGPDNSGPGGAGRALYVANI